MADSLNNLNGKKPIRRKKKTTGRWVVAFIAIVLLIVFGRRPIISLLSPYLNKSPNESVKGEQTIQSQKLEIGREFVFPGIDDNGKKGDDLNLTIPEVEKTDQVIVQEKTYTAKNEKIFLIINLELKNDTTKRLNIFPGDLIRLIVNGDQEKMFAPDLHNNYVLVAPISTKTERVGFIINKDVKDLELQVGELEEEKEVISLNF